MNATSSILFSRDITTAPSNSVKCSPVPKDHRESEMIAACMGRVRGDLRGTLIAAPPRAHLVYTGEELEEPLNLFGLEWRPGTPGTAASRSRTTSRAKMTGNARNIHAQLACHV